MTNHQSIDKLLNEKTSTFPKICRCQMQKKNVNNIREKLDKKEYLRL